TPSVRSSSRTASSPTTRSAVTSTRRMPRCFTSPTLYFSSIPGSSAVELRIMPENALAIECNSPPRGQILFQPRPRRHPAVQLDEQRITALEPAHRAREGIAQAGDHLEERQVGVMDPVAAGPLPRW